MLSEIFNIKSRVISFPLESDPFDVVYLVSDTSSDFIFVNYQNSLLRLQNSWRWKKSSMSVSECYIIIPSVSSYKPYIITR